MPEATHRRAQALFGTLCWIEAAGDAGCLDAAVEAGFAQLRRVQAVLNPHDAGSELCRLNAAAGRGPQRVSPELLAMVAQAGRWSARTDGRYDLTIWPALELWQRAQRAQRWPTEAQRAAAAACVDYRRVVADEAGGTVALTSPSTRIDLSSVAKGAALDAALAAMRGWPVDRAVLNAGGEVLAWDRWRRPVIVEVAHPLDRGSGMGQVALTNGAVATSAQGEPHLSIDGARIGHLLDPKSAMPVDAGLLSVSVAAPSAWLADLLSTVAFVAGLQRSVDWIDAEPGVGALFVWRAHERIERLVTSGMPSVAWCPLELELEGRLA